MKFSTDDPLEYSPSARGSAQRNSGPRNFSKRSSFGVTSDDSDSDEDDDNMSRPISRAPTPAAKLFKTSVHDGDSATIEPAFIRPAKVRNLLTDDEKWHMRETVQAIRARVRHRDPYEEFARKVKEEATATARKNAIANRQRITEERDNRRKAHVAKLAAMHEQQVAEVTAILTQVDLRRNRAQETLKRLYAAKKETMWKSVREACEVEAARQREVGALIEKRKLEFEKRRLEAEKKKLEEEKNKMDQVKQRMDEDERKQAETEQARKDREEATSMGMSFDKGKGKATDLDQARANAEQRLGGVMAGFGTPADMQALAQQQQEQTKSRVQLSKENEDLAQQLEDEMLAEEEQEEAQKKDADAVQAMLQPGGQAPGPSKPQGTPVKKLGEKELGEQAKLIRNHFDAETAEGDWKRARNLLKQLKTRYLAVMKGRKEEKREWNRFRREVTPKVGQVTDDPQEIARITGTITSLFNSDMSEELRFSCLSALAKAILNQAETEVTIQPRSVGPLTHLLSNLLAGIPDFYDVCYIRLVQRTGGWAVPYRVADKDWDYNPFPDDVSRRKAMGKSEDEEDTEFGLRVSGVMRLYFDLMFTFPSKRPSRYYQCQRHWQWLARLCHDPELMESPVAAIMLHLAVEMGGERAVHIFGQQYLKLLALIWEGVTIGISGDPAKRIGGSEPEANAARVRTQNSIDAIISKVSGRSR